MVCTAYTCKTRGPVHLQHGDRPASVYYVIGTGSKQALCMVPEGEGAVLVELDRRDGRVRSLAREKDGAYSFLLFNK